MKYLTIERSFPGALLFALIDDENQPQKGVVFLDSKGRIGWASIASQDYLLLSDHTDFKEAEANLARLAVMPALIPDDPVENTHSGPPNRTTDKAKLRFPQVKIPLPSFWMLTSLTWTQVK